MDTQKYSYCKSGYKILYVMGSWFCLEQTPKLCLVDKKKKKKTKRIYIRMSMVVLKIEGI